MAPFDPDAFLSSPAPAAAAFDPDAFIAGPKSIGRAAQDLTPEQEYRQKLVQRKLETEGEPGYGYRFKDNFTMGLNRPISGVAALPGADAPEGISAGEKWRAGVGAEEDYARRADANTNKYAGAAVDILGGLATGGPGAALSRNVGKVAVEAPSFLSKVGRAMLGSAGSGAIEGAARNAESVPNALVGAGVGGTVGGVTGGVLGAATSRLPGVRGAQKEVAEAVREGGSKALKDEGGAIYQKLDQAGIKFKDTDTPALVTSTAQKMADKGFNKEIHKELIPALEQIGALKGKPATWTQLQNIRTQISDAKASDDKRVRRMAGHLGDVLDDFVENTRPVLPPRSIGINVGAESKTAKDLWRRGSQAEGAEFLAEKGMLTTKNAPRKLETNFGAEHDKIINPKRFSSFQNEPTKVAQIAEIAKGDPRLSKAASGLNRWGNNLIGYGTAGAAGAAGLSNYFGDQYGIGSGVTGAGLTAIGAGLLAKRGGSVARNMATRRGGERVDDLVRDIVTGSSNRDVVNTPREALAKVLAAEQLKRAGARYSSNFFDKE
jgi:hypothetical protein